MCETVIALKAELKNRGISNRKSVALIPLSLGTIQRTLSGKIECTERVEKLFKQALEQLRATSIKQQKIAVIQEVESLYASGVPRRKIAELARIPHGAIIQMMSRERLVDDIWLKAYENLIKKTPRDSGHGSVNAK